MIEHYTVERDTTSVAPLCFQKGSELTFLVQNAEVPNRQHKTHVERQSDMVTDGHRKLLENMEWMHEEEFLTRHHYGRN